MSGKSYVQSLLGLEAARRLGQATLIPDSATAQPVDRQDDDQANAFVGAEIPPRPSALFDREAARTARGGATDDPRRLRIVPPATVADATTPEASVLAPATTVRSSPAAGLYLPVSFKFSAALVASLVWLALSTLLALPWMHDLAALTGWPIALFAVCGIALLPGFMNAFLATGLLLDRRPPRNPAHTYPPLSILVAAYNEESSIADTLRSIASQNYPAPFEVLVVDDGSLDGTAGVVAASGYPWVRLIRQPRNMGKSAALNRGLEEALYALIVTLDADSYLYRGALTNLVERYLGDPAHTRAVAGTMLVRNSRRNWVTRVQEWDYFHGIAAIKRVQSLFQGTMVAQGAFSLYDRQALREVGGWAPCVGEDIVLTWAMLQKGWRVGHAEDACCFTNVPDTLKQFVRQRQRWSRGMIEAFRRFPAILVRPRLSTLFVWWNLAFPWLDLAYAVFFLPGLVLALFGIYWIVGPLTIALLPMALAMNLLMFRVESRMFRSQGLRVRRNASGFLTYAFVYSLILQPACVAGYFSELLGMRKTWGTK